MESQRFVLTAIVFGLLPALLLLGQPLHAQEDATSPPVSSDQLLQDPRVQEAIHLLDVWLEAQWAYEQMPGMSVGVVRDQDLIWSRGFGFADVEGKTPATPETIYSICSISKLFTSIGVMQLRDAGELSLDDAVAKHVPWFKIKKTFPDAGPITVEGLLTHSAGVPRETDHPYWSSEGFPFPTRDEVIDSSSKQSTLYPANTYYQYSNLGFTLAGELITQLSGQTYNDYVQAKILDPLGLKQTRPAIPSDDCCGQLATGYGFLNRSGTREKLPRFQVRGITPAAGFSSNVRDLGRFAAWQFRLLETDKEEVLRANTLREMQRVHWIDPDWSPESHRGLGFAVWRDDDRTFVGHGGACPGYLTHLSMDLKRKVAAIFMTNGLGTNVRLHTRRTHQILGAALDEAATDPDEAKEPDEALNKYQGLYRNPWGEVAVVIWKGELNLLQLPTEDPLDALKKLKKDGEHTFRRVRDDEELGEQIRFEVDADGSVERLWRHGNFSTRQE